MRNAPILFLLGILLPGASGLLAGGAGDPPDLTVSFHKGGAGPAHPTMRFGLVLPRQADPLHQGRVKRLTYQGDGQSSNTCLKIEGREHLLGSPPGTWTEREGRLDKDPQHQERVGLRSVYLYDEQVQVTQEVEIVRNAHTGKKDTCAVRYTLENLGDRACSVGLRYLLDTRIGTNDGAPFIVPGRKALCDTALEIEENLPSILLALERLNLQLPGVIAQVTMSGGPIERPSKVAIGGWPDPRFNLPEAKGAATLWNVPLVSMRRYNDSALVFYWNEKKLEPGAKRVVGFDYGLGALSVEETGQLGVLLRPSTQPREVMVLALVNSPKPKQTLKLELPEGLELRTGNETQDVPEPGRDAVVQLVPVTWTIRFNSPGRYQVTVRSSTGVAQQHSLVVGGK